MALTSIFESSSSQKRWIRQISEILDEEVKVVIDVPVSIFRVPTSLSVFKPEAYMPQLIGLGPYHHFRPELYEIERYKLAAARRVQKQFQSLEFKQLVDKITELEHQVRSCYHKYLDIDGDTLAWVMAIDGLFLLEFLHTFINRKDSQSSSSTTAHLVDSAGRKFTHGAILGDIVMLENQIPIFFLSKLLSFQCSLPDVTNDMLSSMLMGFCKAISPLKLMEDLPLSQVSEHAHLLDLLYHLTVPKLEGPHGASNINWTPGAASSVEESCNSCQVFAKLWNLLSMLNVGLLRKITKPIKTIIGVSGNFVSNLPGMSFLPSKKKEKTEDGDPGEDKKTPVVEQIMIPSVSYLCGACVEFCPTTGGIATVQFDEKNKKFHLPVITLNVNSEVVMRNLVAYEACTVTESLVFTRYTELMNGIIDTVEDAKLLREKKIIINSLKSDADVAELFNGMSKSIRLTKVPHIDKTIEDVNKYYNDTLKVKVYKRLKKFGFGSWHILTIIAVILLLVLMGIQSFCSVYSCPRIFNTGSTS